MSHVIPWVRYPRPKSQWSMVIVVETELNNKSIYIYIYVFRNWASYYKLGQYLLPIGGGVIN